MTGAESAQTTMSKAINEEKKETISEETAYRYGLEIWFRIKLNRCFPSVKEKMLKDIPDFMEHYRKEEGFESEKDADEFMKWLTITYQITNRKTFRHMLNDTCSYADMIMDILKDKPLP